MSPTRQKIEFAPNVPVVCTLQYAGGKEVAGRKGPQYLYWVDNNRSMFLDPDVHEQIQASGAGEGDTLEITQVQRGRMKHWEVVHLLDEPNGSAELPPAAAAAPRSQPRHNSAAPSPRRANASQPAPAAPPAIAEQPAAPITKTTGDLLAAFCTAIDALAEASSYARRKGIDMPITAESIRATALSVYIGRRQGGER